MLEGVHLGVVDVFELKFCCLLVLATNRNIGEYLIQQFARIC